MLPFGYLIVCFVHVSVCASVQLEMHRPENTNKIKDVWALTCTLFHFIFYFYCFFILWKICMFSYERGVRTISRLIHGIARQIGRIHWVVDIYRCGLSFVSPSL